MTPRRFMVIAGEASGDLLAAELVTTVRERLAQRQARPTSDSQPLQASLEPEFFGAGGTAMKAAGVDLAFDLTAHAVVGLVEVLKNYKSFRRLFLQLLKLAIARQPHAIICVDFSGFNRRFAHAVQKHVRHQSAFLNWHPKLIQYVSPQVWASRAGRADKMARDFDLLLSIFPFEKEWYARRVPGFRVEFVGHPLVDRYRSLSQTEGDTTQWPPLVVLLPGSRDSELNRHLPVMREALAAMQREIDLRWEMVVPNESLADRAKREFSGISGGAIRSGGLAEALPRADLAIASTGTVTLECAWFGVPVVALYKTSWTTYQVGKRVVKVRFLAMPNLLADEQIYPELIQGEATGAKIAEASVKLLRNPAQRQAIRAKLKNVVDRLGPPGAAGRAADATLDLLSV